MNLSINDYATLGTVTPADLSAYLRSGGWLLRDAGDRNAIWAQGAGSGRREYEVSQPLRPEMDDYAVRLREVFQVLAAAESRSQLDILRDIQDARADVVRIRLRGAAYEQGFLGIERATKVVAHARDLMLAAACAAVRPRLVYRSARLPRRAVNYLRHVQLGQTERGSYVLHIRSLVPTRLTSALNQVENPSWFASEEPPFERQVTETLARALTATNSALAHVNLTGDLGALQDAVREGVSANLCAAVAGLGGIETDEVEIGFHWAANLPLPPDAPGVSPILLPRASLAILNDAARELSALAAYGDFGTSENRGPAALPSPD